MCVTTDQSMVQLLKDEQTIKEEARFTVATHRIYSIRKQDNRIKNHRIQLRIYNESYLVYEFNSLFIYDNQIYITVVSICFSGDGVLQKVIIFIKTVIFLG